MKKLLVLLVLLFVLSAGGTVVASPTLLIDPKSGVSINPGETVYWVVDLTKPTAQYRPDECSDKRFSHAFETMSGVSSASGSTLTVAWRVNNHSGGGVTNHFSWDLCTENTLQNAINHYSGATVEPQTFNPKSARYLRIEYTWGIQSHDSYGPILKGRLSIH